MGVTMDTSSLSIITIDLKYYTYEFPSSQAVLKTGYPIQSRLYDLMHIIVPVFGQTSAENYSGLLIGQCPVFLIQSAVILIVYRIIGIVAGFPFFGIFFRNDRIGLQPEFEMLMFDDSSKRSVRIRVIDNRVSLIIGFSFEQFGLKIQTAVLKTTVTVIEVPVDLSLSLIHI
mgnify:CR=1 FL=1